MPVLLGQVAQGRDNNFNLIRILAAAAVLVSHAWPITLGTTLPEPLKETTGFSLGTWAVYAFFVISGFLITASFERTASHRRFIAARALRLLPGLAVSLVLVAFCIGPVVTSLPLQEYLTHPDTLRFVPINLAMVVPQYTLPGVFEDQPVQAIEGSIWTLFYEVACYAGVFLAGWIGLLSRQWRFGLALLAYGGVLVLEAGLDPTLPLQIHLLLDLSLPFVFGMVLWVWRVWIPMSIWIALALGGLAWLSYGSPFYRLCLVVALGYGLFWLAYIPKGWIRRYNQVGDYSYGLYIYAFPMQGLAVWLVGPQGGPWVNVAVALPLTLIPSVLSWHLVEAPALQMLKRFPAGAGRSAAP